MHRPIDARPRRRWPAALAALFVLAAPLAAQTTPDSTPAPARAGAGQTVEPQERGPLLDAPVTRTGYQLGAGDRVDVAIFGDYNHVYTLQVGPEGTVVIPGVGIATVGGLNLDQAEGRVRQVVGRYYRNVDVRLSLAQVRSFKVFLVGDVPRPGVRVANAATRVSEVVTGSTDAASGVRRRNVTLRRASGEVIPVDLVRFSQLGDVSANPTLREGDAVVVPAIDEHVRIFGRVHFDGAYEFRRGESLAELLTIANAGGGFPAEAGDTVRLVRYLENGTRTVVAFSRQEAIGARGRAFLLQPFDAVYVPSTANFRVMKTATVAGQVINPGIFPIRPDTTTLRELVAMAGGFTPEASLVGATLRRQPPTTGTARDELANIPPELLTEEDRRILQVRNSSDATRVVVDLAALFAAGSDVLDLPVRNGDVLSVPSRRFDVSVLGAVRDPGLVPHRPGAGVETYLAAAGGLGQRADRRHVVVIKAATGARVSMFEVRELEPGDAVIVPFRKETTALSVLQIAQAVVGTVAGLVLTAVAVFR